LAHDHSEVVLFYGAYALIDGVLAIYRDHRCRVTATLMAGYRRPDRHCRKPLDVHDARSHTIVLLHFIAVWAIATGVFQIIGAIKLRKEIDNEWLLIVGNSSGLR
jgi:Short repeat of unknown function (DUF308)